MNDVSWSGIQLWETRTQLEERHELREEILQRTSLERRELFIRMNWEKKSEYERRKYTRVSQMREEKWIREKKIYSSITDVVLYEGWVSSSSLDDTKRKRRYKWNKANVSRDEITWRIRQTQSRTHKIGLAIN